MIFTIKTENDKIALLRTLSGLLINLSAGWYAVILIPISHWNVGSLNILVLIADIFFGTLCFGLSYELEKLIS